MDDLILPFRRGKREHEEKKKKLKERIGTSLALSHKAKSRMKEADIEFEKAFAEVMGLPAGEAGKPRPAERKPKKAVPRKKEKKKPVAELRVPGKLKKEAKKPKPARKPAAEPKVPQKPGKEPAAEKKAEPKGVRIIGRKGVLKKWPAFYFWYTKESASSLAEFKKAIKKIPASSLNHHAIHNDFSKYLREVLNKKTANKVEEFENLYKSKELRDKLLGLL